MGGDSRTYIKVSDSLPEHRKIVAVGGDAAWLHVCALAYASRNLTDGLIPEAVVPRLSDRKQPVRLAGKLTEVGLWHAAGHDCKRCPQPGSSEYVIHDYLVHQRSAAKVGEIRHKRADAGRAGGNGKAANAKQTASNLLSDLADGCNGVAVANGTPVSEEVLRTSQTVTEEVQEMPPPAARAPRQTPGKLPGMPVSAKPETPGQRTNRLAKIYTDQVPISNFPAVAKIVRKAVDADCTDEHITQGLLKVIGDNFSLTTETLRVAMFGPPRTGDRAQQATDAKFDRAMERARAREAAAE